MVNKLLLTGFGPFLNFGYNPSGAIAKELDGKILGNYEIIGRVLPVNHKDSVSKLIKLIEHEKPDIVIATGLASSKGSITLERIAINRYYFVESDGTVHDEAISPKGPAAYFSTLPLERIKKKLEKASIPVEYSFWPDTFVSNEIFYALMDYAKNNGIKNAGFVHLPLTHKQLVENKRLHYMVKSNMPSLEEKIEKKAIETAIKITINQK